MSAPFRFGVNMIATESKAEWIEKCRRAEELGYDVIGVADHLGVPAPIPAMLAAADATERVQINSFVLNVPFYNPVLLARDIATIDQLSGGRVELGLGAGYVQAEFETAGIPFPSAGRRVDQVAEAAATLRRLFADPEYKPKPARPGGPPLLIAGWGDRLLRVAAEHADIIAFTGGTTSDSGRIAVALPEQADERVAYVRGRLGNRRDSVEFNILVQALALPGERAKVLDWITTHLPEGAADRLEEIPTLLVGSYEEMAEELRARRKRYGFGYITVLETNMEKFAPLIPLLR